MMVGPFSKIPALLRAVLVVAGVYVAATAVFTGLLGQPIPASLMTMYMFFVIIGTFMAFTFTEDGARAMAAPIRALVENPSLRLLRNIVFLLMPLAAAGFTYVKMLPSLEAPIELRAIHPAPPATFKAFGKRYNLLDLVNPFRKYKKEDPKKFRALVAEGGKIYIRNCQYCHGDKLNGRGPFATALNPTPLNFQDVGTIAQLQESFLFWRIATGGPGLPEEAAPWISSMPVWQNFLKEDQIWKVILFLYDYTGRRPRAWEK